MNDNKLIAIYIIAFFSFLITAFGIDELTKETPHEQRMQVLEELEYENSILKDMDREERIVEFKQELDSIHAIQDSILKMK